MRERELIEAIEGVLGPAGAELRGDDAAVIAGNGVAVTSIDTVAYGFHFRLDTHSPADAGHKALATALSDLAAMGAKTGQAYVSLALPPELGSERSLELVGGLAELARETGTVVAGGDVVAAAALVVSVAVTGWADDGDLLVRRDGARVADRVGVTGTLGGSGAGLLALGGTDAGIGDDVRTGLVERHRRPQPLLALGQALAAAGVTAMIDVSDGVATDAAHLAEKSGATVTVELGRLPLDRGVEEVARLAGRDPHEFAATAGDDYELLFTAGADATESVEAAARDAGSSVTWIGEVSEGPAGLTLVDASGAPADLAGHEH